MNPKRTFDSVGFSMLSGYFALFYFAPLFLLLFYGPHPFLKYEGNFFKNLIAILITILLSFFFISTKITLPTSWARILPNIFSKSRIPLVLAICTFPIAVYFYINFGISFRYSSGGLSNSGIVPKIIYLYKAYYYPFILYYFFSILGGQKISGRDRLFILLHTINWFFCATGSADMIWLTVGTLMALLGHTSKNIFTRKSTHTSLSNFILMRALIIILSGAAAALIIFFGFSNKIGSEAAIERIVSGDLNFIFHYLYYRLSIFIASMDYAISKGLFNFQFYETTFATIYDMMTYRIKTILGLSLNHPEYEGINHLNYFEIYAKPANERSGASPGIIGAFMYLPMLPLNFIFCGAYIGAVVNSINRASPIQEGLKPNLFATLFLVIGSYTLLNSPVESFLKIGPEILTTLMYLYAIEKAAVQADFRIKSDQSRQPKLVSGNMSS